MDSANGIFGLLPLINGGFDVLTSHCLRSCMYIWAFILEGFGVPTDAEKSVRLTLARTV